MLKPEPLNILIIDEDKDHCEKLANTLSRLGMTTTSVYDGVEALKIIKDQSFDIAVCDINIPKKDGYEVYREMQQSPPPHPRFIFQYNDQDEVDTTNFLTSTIATIKKPFRSENIIDVIDSLRYKILLIEDNKLSSELTSKRLRKAGYLVDQHYEGTTAIQALNRNPYDLILLDYLLPDMLGFEILQHLKTIKNNSEKPVILLTAEDETNTIVEAFSLGACDYIIKPFDFKTLHARIAAHIISGKKSLDLNSARQTALRSSNLKSTFLANMGHEIRTPLNGILGTADILKQTAITEEQRSYVEIIESAGHTLMMILNDLLDMSKIESGNLTIERKSFSVSELMKSSLELFFQNAEKKKIDINCFIDEEIPKEIVGDPARLRQILTNLISNALKFSPENSGEIFLNLSMQRKDKTKFFIRFDVHDNGIGMKAEEQKKIFNPFSQANNKTFRKFGGTGLGLSICKQLTNIMGGDIGVISKPKEGSTFWFTVPIERQNTPKDSIKQSSKIFKDKNITLIHKNPMAGLALTQMMKKIGFNNVQLFSNISETINEIDSNTNIILIDSKVISESRSPKNLLDLDSLKSYSCFISKFSDEDIPDRASESHFTPVGLIKKPVRIENAKTIFTKFLSRNEESHLSPAKPLRKVEDTSKGKVLVIDDDKTNQFIFEKMLSQIGYRSSIAGSGESALREVTNSKFDLILLDYNLPDYKGSDLARQIRSSLHGRNSDIPILGVTASQRKEDIDDCISSGMDAILEKPTTTVKLENAIKVLMKESNSKKVS